MKRLLIANRGEIAIRVARSAADMGLTTLGIYAEDDTDSLHVARMDKALALNGRGARAYLDAKQIVARAREAGADAVHPGYGFLSENAAFAQAVEEAGLVFVGPTPKTLALFGDKAQALKLAKEADVATPAGRSEIADPEDARDFFKTLGDGKAMMLKAVSGGGGRGVRIVRTLEEVEDAFQRAASEAQASFGDPSLYVEEYLDKARHIEVQIIGDGKSAVSHLWERDCSLQRRHQKIVEIAPSPSLDAELRQDIVKAAVALGKVSDYRGLGTMEFLVSGGDFRFIEGNARLQVEHTVTEEVLGLDLVRTQLEIACGKSLRELGLQQSRVPEPRGYAIQARINLERMKADGTVRPGGGRLSIFEAPSGPGVRTDTYARAGYKPNPAFDSLIAKLIVHSPAPEYESAVARLKRALSEFVLEGAPSNIAFHQALMSDPRVASNEVHTRFIDEHAAEIISLIETSEPAKLTEGDPASLTSDPLAVLNHGSDASEIASARKPVVQTDVATPEGVVTVHAPMQGAMINFTVSAGDPVWAGRTVAIIEAMKMEHEVRANQSGIVRELGAKVGDAVREGQPLVYLDAQDVEANARADGAHVDLDHIRPDLQRALDRITAGHDESRPEAVTKRHARGHRTARENIADLCDPDSFVEYGSLTLAAQRKRRDLDDLVKNTTGDGMVCGLGHVNGDLFPEDRSRIMAMSYDYMVLAGTQGALNHYKKDRMFEIAREQRLPTVLYAEGGGGRPGDTDVSGVAGLDCLAFGRFAELSGLAPTIGIVNGRCFAGNAVLLGCCDVIIATESANIGIGGPAMIEGGGLGVFKPEEVGPINVQTANGVVDIAVKDEAEATATAKQYLSYFQGAVQDWDAPDARELRFIVPEARKRWYDMRKVIKGIADIGSVLELRPTFGIGVHTCLIRVEGRPVGVIANNPGHLSGAIDAPAADKSARFMQLCDAYDIPIVSLIDCPGIMVGPEIEKTALVRHASRMMVVGANITTPLMTFIIRKGYGLGAQAMAGGGFKSPLFTLSWPTGEFGGMGLEGAVKLGFRKELEAIKDPEERLKAYEEMVARMYERGSAVNMASHFEIDDVIDPADTRKRIMSGLKALPPNPVRTGKKRPNIDTW